MADSADQNLIVDEVAIAVTVAVAVPSPSEQAAEPEGPVAADSTADAAPTTADEEPEEDLNSKKVTLADLCAKGAALYAHKNYAEAAECYSLAAEQQAEMNGDMSPENSEILFLYGRSLFKMGQSKSDVLGGKAPAEKKKPTNGTTKPTKKPAVDRVAEEGVAIVAADKEGTKNDDEVLEAKKPLFQFTGDENFDDSDEDEGADGEEVEGEEEEEDDDLASAFEVLDLGRVLFTKRLEEWEKGAAKGKGKVLENVDELTIKHVKERLADTHDLLAEISLENERYPNAIVDSRASLSYKKELYPEESEILAEAHFKLSLALEFASMTHTEDDSKDSEAGQKAFDQELRDEAARELEAAIASTKAKLQNKEVELATMASPEDNDITRQQIVDVKEIIADMEQRLVELRKPPIDVNAALYGSGGIAAASNPMGGILGAALGESAAETEARVQEAKKNANDLSGLVRKKNRDEARPSPAPTAAPEADAQSNGHATSNGSGKRKAEEDAPTPEETKKARVENELET